MLIDLKSGLNASGKLLLIMIVAIFNKCYGQINNKATEILQKRVRCQIMYSCSPDGTDCFILEKKYFNKNGSQQKTEEFILNEVYKTSRYFYNKSGLLDSIVVDFSKNSLQNYSTSFKYNSNGNLIEEKMKALGEITGQKEFIYNNGQLISEVHSGDNKKIIEKKYFYDENKNNYKEIVKYFPEKDEEIILKYYNQQNVLVKIVYPGHKEIYFYDNNNKLVKKNFINNIDEIEESEVIAYNNELLASSIIQNANQEISLYIKFEYDYF